MNENQDHSGAPRDSQTQQNQQNQQNQQQDWQQQDRSQQDRGQFGENASGADRQQSQFDSGHAQYGDEATTSPFADQIREHMEVVGADGQHVGTVDHIDGDRIKLTKRDNAEGHDDHHHYLSLSMVDGVDGDRVRLSANADQARGQEQER